MSFADFVRRLFRGSAPPPMAGVNTAPSGDETTRWQKALADFGFPYIVVTSLEAEAALEAERQVGQQEGYSPVIIFPGLWISTPATPAARIKRARGVPLDRYDAGFGRAFLARKFAQLHQDLADDPECLDPAMFDDLQPIAAQSLSRGLHLHRKYNSATQSMEPVAEVAIMRIPTTDGDTIPVYLDWGGWNAAPSPLEICAVSRHWGETHGARLIAIGSDTIEFTVARKPATHAAAVALLKEHCCFSRDIWENDQGDMEQAAAQLRVSDTWFFWWD